MTGDTPDHGTPDFSLLLTVQCSAESVEGIPVHTWTGRPTLAPAQITALTLEQHSQLLKRLQPLTFKVDTAAIEFKHASVC